MPCTLNIFCPVLIMIYLAQKFYSGETRSQVNHTFVFSRIWYAMRLLHYDESSVNVLCKDIFLSFISSNNPTGYVPLNYHQMSLSPEC